jgi:quinol monooxygenase YgiN
MSKAIVLTPNKIVLLVATSILAGFLICRLRSATKHEARISNGVGAFVLLVNMNFSSLSYRDTFLDLIEPLCNYVIANESPVGSRRSTMTTLSYQVAISDKNPLEVLVLERYSDKDNGYLRVHKSGGEFLKFREQLKGMQDRGEVQIEGESYLETTLGFV